MRFQKYIFVILLLIVALPLVSAESSTTILNKWVDYQYTFTNGGNNYSITPLNTWLEDYEDSMVKFTRNGESQIVKYQECETNQFYTYCFDNLTTDSSLTDIDDQGRVQPALKLRIIEYKYEDALKVTKTVTKTALYLEEEVEVNVKLSNIGDFDLTDLKLTETIPEGYEVVKTSSNWNLIGSKIETTTLILAGKEKEYTYTIKAKEYVLGDIITSVIYTAEGHVNNNFADVKKTFTVKTPYTLTSNLDKKSINVDEEVLLKLNLENNENEDLIIKQINFKISPALTVKEFNGLKKDNSYTYYGNDITLIPTAKKEFLMKIKGPYTGEYKLSQSIRFSVKGKEFTEIFEYTLNVTTEGLDCKIVPDKDVINPGETVSYSIIIENKANDPYNFIEVDVVDESSVYGYELQMLNAKSSHTLDKKTITASMNPTENIVLKINGQYETKTRQILECYSQTIIGINSTSIVEDVPVVDGPEIVNDEETNVPVIVQDEEDSSGMNFFEKIWYLIRKIF